MKKKYEKPMIYAESFELSQHIAGCNLTLLNQDVSNCGASGTIGEDTLDGTTGAWFLEDTTVCSVVVEDYCWTNGTINITTIMS